MRNNPKSGTNEDYNFDRCRNCKFPIDKSRVRVLKTSSISYASVTYTALSGPAEIEIGGETVTIGGEIATMGGYTGSSTVTSTTVKNPTVNGGCPFCGCPQPY